MPKLFKEHLLAKTHGWTIEYIRGLEYFEFERFFNLAMISERYDNYNLMNVMSIASIGKGLRST